jgi:magnesium chelatase subunit D
VLMGADIAHLQRHGKQEYWQPNLCWLAGCPSNQIGMISPHILDRFALRLSGQRTKTTDTTERVTELLELINRQTSRQETQSEPLPKEIQDSLKTALQHHPEITSPATAQIIAYTSALEVYTQRREIALARLAVANAQLDGAAAISATHVDAAAQMIGLKPIIKPIETPENQTVESLTPKLEPLTTTTQFKQPTPKFPDPTVLEPIYRSDNPEPIESTLLTSLDNPYQSEDTAPVEREAASLSLPTGRSHSKTVARGTIIGVEKAKNFQDIALVRTLLEAAKFQPIRQKSPKYIPGKLNLLATDFHSYRRAPVAEQMLMLLLDHTCLQDCNWQEELSPYLGWAYVERASICLIQVGAANAQHELRAEKITAQNILVPRINAGIEAGKGKATPLAHGLDLALQTLRHALQHGRSTVQRAVLVVITDGRGNVPLEASRTGKISPPVGRKGIEDALLVAESISSLDNVITVLLNPQPQQYPELPQQLTQKFKKATLVAIPPLEIGEEEYV